MSDVFNNVSICKVTSCGKLYTHVGFEEGQNTPCRVMATLGKAGNCQACHLEAFTTGLNVVLDIQDVKAFFRILSETAGIRCPKPYPGAAVDNALPLSCIDGMVKAIYEATRMRTGLPVSSELVVVEELKQSGDVGVLFGYTVSIVGASPTSLCLGVGFNWSVSQAVSAVLTQLVGIRLADKFTVLVFSL